jgi:two-component system chemotaxis response regulator CheY
MSGKRVLSVGQCGADHASISRTLQQHFTSEVLSVDSAAEALAKLRQERFALVLVNRVLDADGSSGLDVLRQIQAAEDLKQIPVMLVSNHKDAQREAIAAGAERGFGKAALGHPAMLARVKPFLSEA